MSAKSALDGRKPASPKGGRVKWLMALSLAQTAAIAFLGFGFLDLAARTERLTRSALPAQGDAPVIRTGTTAATPAEIRAIVREEIAGLRADPARQAAMPEAKTGAASSRVVAVDAGAVRRELESRLARGRMTSLEVEQFLAETAELPADQREQVMKKFFGAINSGELDARL